MRDKGRLTDFFIVADRLYTAFVRPKGCYCAGLGIPSVCRG
jgi:hypothetical protein